MPHEIDLSTGKPAIAYVGEMPWHGLGEELPAGQPIEVWLKAARLEWEIEKLPMQYVLDGRLRTFDDKFVLARSDTGAALSTVSSDYQVVQPKDVLEFYRDLMKTYGYTLETAGALSGGRKVWAMARTGRKGPIGNSDDELAAYVLLATSCDKSLATTAAFTSIRVVCQNTLFFAVDDIETNKRPQVKVPHNLHFDARDVQLKLGMIDEAWESFLAAVSKMAARSLKREEAASYFTRLLSPPSGKPLSPKAAREHHSLMGLYRSAPGQDLTTAKETLWGAVNAAMYYADHVRTAATIDRLDSSWFGSGSTLKGKAWAIASGMIAT